MTQGPYYVEERRKRNLFIYHLHSAQTPYVLGLILSDFQILTHNIHKFSARRFHIYYLCWSPSKRYLGSTHTRIMVLLLTMMISKSIQNQSLQPPCEVSIWASLLLRCREIHIPHKFPWPLSARAKNKTWVFQTPKLIVLQQRHGTGSKPKGEWADWCSPAAISAKGLMRPPCGRYSRWTLPIQQTQCLGTPKLRWDRGLGAWDQDPGRDRNCGLCKL